MAKKIIYTADMSLFRPVIWYGLPVIHRFPQINAVLREKLGDEFADFISEPLVTGDKIVYLSESVAKPTEFTKLNTEKQEFIRVKLQQTLGKIKDFAAELKTSSDPHEKELGELLDFSTEVPSLDSVLVEDNKIVLAAWGLSSETSFKENFKLDVKIQKPISDEKPPQKPTETSASSNQSQQPDIQEEKTVIETPPTHNEPPATPTSEGSKKPLPPWIWFLLGVLLTLIVILCLRNCENDIIQTTDNHQDIKDTKEIIHEILPDNPTIVPPVDTTKVIVEPDDPGKRKVFSDKVNVAIAKGVSIEDFAVSLHERYRDSIRIVYYDTAINLLQIQTPEGEYKQWIDKLKLFTNVKLAFSNTLFENGAKPTSDPGFSNSIQSWYFQEIQAYDAWDITEGDSSVIIAVCDNCFDTLHPEFKGKIVSPYNVTTGENAVGIVRAEDNDHGTHVAGTAAGVSGNQKGLCGIAPKCRLMPIQIADENGNMQSISIVAGILYAIHHNASVINLSVGTYFNEEITQLSSQVQEELLQFYSPDENIFWNELFQFALDENTVVVLAAGNQNIMAGIDPFARTDKALVVAAYTKAAKPKADFSNFGRFSNISAPGVKIYSSVPGGGFAFMDGTSMASPVVAGAVALMRSKYPEMTAQEIISTIISKGKPLNSTPEIGPLLQIADALKQ